MNKQIAMVGLGGRGIAVIAIAMVILFGSKKIPELAKGLGESIREFKKATKDKQENFKNENVERTTEITIKRLT